MSRERKVVTYRVVRARPSDDVEAMSIFGQPWLVECNGKPWLAYGQPLVVASAYDPVDDEWSYSVRRVMIRPYSGDVRKYPLGVVGEPPYPAVVTHGKVSTTFEDYLNDQALQEQVKALKAQIDAKVMALTIMPLQQTILDNLSANRPTVFGRTLLDEE